MHQPWYGDPWSGRMRLPWVRLHALKDYLDMVAVVEEHPGVKVTFNLVPSLLAQVDLYARGETTDDPLELARRDAGELTPADQQWWLANGFRCHWPRMLDPVPRYRELLDQRGRREGAGGLDRGRTDYAAQDFRDLQVWFHLAWCGHVLRRDTVVKELIAKERDFTEDDKQALLDHLDEAVRGVIPRYAAAVKAGRIEVSTTPYYHPILPLLCHYADARVAMPDVILPTGREDIPEDAATQLREGRRLAAELLGHEPVGLWPSEGSVSDPALQLAAEAGFRWAASDEDVLSRSLPGEHHGLAHLRAQAHQFGDLALFFRHHGASDRIGFDYATWPAEQAVTDFLRILEFSARAAADVERPVVPVILDGENCWEYYPDNGYPFLSRLYEKLAEHRWLEAVTFSEHLELSPTTSRLDHVFPGSWINHNFYIWAGHREDRRGWELLYRARRALVEAGGRVDEAQRRQAWEHLYIAEGSDWFWWYGDDHASDDDWVFDDLFRAHLRRIYELLEMSPPGELFEPVTEQTATDGGRRPTMPFTPVLDGQETSFFEWRAAGWMGLEQPAGAMSRATAMRVVASLRYGFDREHAYLAVELVPPSHPATPDGLELALEWTARGETTTLTVAEPLCEGVREVPLAGHDGTAWVAGGRLLEIAVPVAALPAGHGETADLVVRLDRDGTRLERWPDRGVFEFALPDDGYWRSRWMA